MNYFLASGCRLDSQTRPEHIFDNREDDKTPFIPLATGNGLIRTSRCLSEDCGVTAEVKRNYISHTEIMKY